MKKRALSLLLALVLCLSLLPVPTLAETDNTRIPYAVEGGNIYFNAETGEIVDCDEAVTAAVIPDKINGVAVTGIGFLAFVSCGLTSITIPKSVTTISDGVFFYSRQLTDIVVAADNPNYCAENGILFDKTKTVLHSYPTASETYRIPDSVTDIRAHAFRGCNRLKEIIIPDSVRSIGDLTFAECIALENIIIPSRVTVIGTALFQSCNSLTNIEVAADNPNYCSENGVLFNKDKTELHCYPSAKDAKTYQIPNSVIHIKVNAFYHCTELTNITIPSRVTGIGTLAFGGCTSLTSVTIPNSVSVIEYNAFNFCTALTDVYYDGAAQQWQAISIMGGNESLTNATIHYNSSGPEPADTAFSLGAAKDYKFSNGTMVTDVVWEGELGTFTPEEAGYYRICVDSTAGFSWQTGLPPISLYAGTGSELKSLSVFNMKRFSQGEASTKNRTGLYYLEANQTVKIVSRALVLTADDQAPFALRCAVYQVEDDHILTGQNGTYPRPTRVDNDTTGANICVIPSHQVSTEGWYTPNDETAAVFWAYPNTYEREWNTPQHLKPGEPIAIYFHDCLSTNFSLQAVTLPTLSVNTEIASDDLFYYKPHGTCSGHFTPEKSGKYVVTASRTGENTAWQYCNIASYPDAALDGGAFTKDGRAYTTTLFLEAGTTYLIYVSRNMEDSAFTLTLRQELDLQPENILTEANCHGLLQYAHFDSISETVTRMDLLKLIVKAARLAVDPSNTELSFSDCGALSAEEKAILKACVNAGFVAGYEDNTFGPNKLVTKAQMAVIIVNALGLENTDVEGGATYADMDGHWAAGYVNKLLNLQIAPQATNFGPDQAATRQDALELLVRACYGGYIDAERAAPPQFKATSYRLTVGETLTLQDLLSYHEASVRLSPSDTTIFDGVTALKPGTVTLYAYHDNGSFTKATVTVSGIDFSINAKDAAYTGLAYDTANITKTSNVETVPAYTWYADNNGAKGEVLEAAPVNAGTYWVEGTITVGAAAVTSAPVKFLITKAPLTITAKDHTITYGESPANDGVEYAGFVNGETADLVSGLSYTYSYEQYGNAGSYAITPTGAAADNYQITLKPGKLTVTQKAVGLTWSGYTDLYYDGQAKAVTATATGLVNEDTVTVTVAGGAQKEVGSYAAKATGLIGAKAANYKLSDTGLTQAYTIAYALERVTASPATVTAAIDQSTRTIRLVGYIGVEEEIDLDGLTVEDGKVTVHGVEYTVDDTGVVVNESNATLEETIPEVAKPEDADESITDTVIDEINNSATGSEGLGNAGAEYIFGEAAKDETITAVEVSLSIQPKALTEISLKLEIKPVVTYKDSGTEVIRTETMPNSAIKAPVTISVKLPADMPTTGLVAKHSLGGGKFEFLSVTVTNGVASWQQSSFSETELIADSRSATVNFTFENDSGQSVTYTAADVDKALPLDSKSGSSFLGWLIGGDATAYKTMTDGLLTALDGQTVQAAPSFQSNVVWVPSTAKPEEHENPFTDVFESDYYYDAVLWAVKQNITSGVSETLFAPNDSCTRAQAVTFLWRAAGEPKAADATNPFEDVDADAYYYDAVLWAVEKGITAGVSETSFAPEDTVTRGQMMAFLWRAADKVGTGLPSGAAGAAFTDVDVEAYYGPAVSWAVAKGITVGTSATTFSPEADCTRAQIVTFLYRHMGK